MSTGQRQETRSSGNAAGSGSTVKARPALDPRVPVLVQPFKGLVETGVIEEIAVTFSSMGTTVKGRASQRLVNVANSGLNTTDYFPVVRLLEVAESGENPILPKFVKKKTVGAGGPAQVKPARSLCVEDFELTPPALQTRINEIARACGGGPLVGRVRSAGAFDGAATVSYRDWWEAAAPNLRCLSLSEGKRLALFSDEMKARLDGLQCPFRGTLEFTVAEADD